MLKGKKNVGCRENYEQKYYQKQQLRTERLQHTKEPNWHFQNSDKEEARKKAPTGNIEAWLRFLTDRYSRKVLAFHKLSHVVT